MYDNYQLLSLIILCMTPDLMPVTLGSDKKKQHGLLHKAPCRTAQFSQEKNDSFHTNHAESSI